MRLFGKPGGTRAQARGALLTIPFDLSLATPVATVNGPLLFHAGMIYRPGAKAAANYAPGAKAGIVE